MADRLNAGEFPPWRKGELRATARRRCPRWRRGEGELAGDLGDLDDGFERLDIAGARGSAAAVGEGPLGAIWKSAVGDLLFAERLIVGRVEFLAQNVAAIADLEGVGVELPCQERGGETDGSRAAAFFAEEKSVVLVARMVR